MRITEKRVIEYGEALTQRFPGLHLETRGSGWSVYDQHRVCLSVPLENNREAVAWMDGFHRGAHEQEQIIRAKVAQLLRNNQAHDDPDYLAAMLSTWLP